ncbi:MAG: hypothetical protein ACJA08_002430 [Cyclobacteriaceae bacterium]|jgi:hypothetical protein
MSNQGKRNCASKFLTEGVKVRFLTLAESLGVSVNRFSQVTVLSLTDIDCIIVCWLIVT